MKDISELIEEIKPFTMAKEIMASPESEDLLRVMDEYESIVQITIGTINGYRGLIVATDERLLFICRDENNQMQVAEEKYQEVQYVHYTSLNHKATLEIFFPYHKLEIRDLITIDAQSMKNEIQEQREFYQSTNKSQTEEPKKKKLGFLKFCFFVGIAILTGYFLGPAFNTYEVEDPILPNGLTLEKVESKYQVTLSDLKIEKDEYDDVTAKGTMTNHSDELYRSVLLDVQYYDKKGNIVESQVEYVYDLKPGQSWNFEFTPYNHPEHVKTFDVVAVEFK